MIVVPRSALQHADLPGRRSANPFADLDSAVSVRHVVIDPAPTRTPHRHPHSAEVVYVVSGTGTAWQDGERHLVGPGDTVLIPQGVHHATLASPEGPLELLCFFPHPDLASNIEELEGPHLTA